MKFLSVLFVALLLNGFAKGQSSQDAARKRFIDSVKKVYVTEAAIRNPALRQVIISSDFISGSDLKSELYKSKLLDGKLSQMRTIILVNVPVKSWGRNSITTSFTFLNQSFNLRDVKGYGSYADAVHDTKINKQTVGFSGTYIRVDSLFGRPAIFTGTLTGLTGSSSAIQKVSYLGGVLVTLKQSANVRTMIGLMLNIDPSIKVPVVPFFTHWHKYSNNLELNADLPRQVMLRKSLSKNSWASFGSSLSGTVAFFSRNQPSIPGDSNFSILDLKTGPGFECRVGKRLMVGVNAGILTPLQAREFETNEDANDYFLKHKIHSTPFMNFTISALPFL